MWPWSLLRRRATPDAPAQPFGMLIPGWRYRVVRAFTDHDRHEHPIGERWIFLRSTFLPYEDGLSLFTATQGGAADQIRLQLRPDAEGAVATALHEYLQPEASGPDGHALLLTRGSVCMSDDADAPNAAPLAVARTADAAAVARAVLDAGYLPWTSTATWSLALGTDRVVLGWGPARDFVYPVGPPSVPARAVERVHLTYHAQAQPDAILARLRQYPA